MNFLQDMKTDEIAFGLSCLVMQRKRFLFRWLSDSEKQELKRLNSEIKTYKNYLKQRQLRLKGF